jgi:hypothetical protein
LIQPVRATGARLSRMVIVPSRLRTAVASDVGARIITPSMTA